MDQEHPTPRLPSATSGPVIVCIDDTPGRSPPLTDQIAALARQLAGDAGVEEVSGTTCVISVRVPPANAARFQSALALAGASFFGPSGDGLTGDFLVVVNRRRQDPIKE